MLSYKHLDQWRGGLPSCAGRVARPVVTDRPCWRLRKRRSPLMGEPGSGHVGSLSPVPDHDCAVMPAENDPPVPSKYTDSARSVPTTRSATWWKNASLASKVSDAGRAEVATLGPRRCLITNSFMDVELCHLVAKGSSLAVVRYLARGVCFHSDPFPCPDPKAPICLGTQVFA